MNCPNLKCNNPRFRLLNNKKGRFVLGKCSNNGCGKVLAIIRNQDISVRDEYREVKTLSSHLITFVIGKKRRKSK